VRRRVPGPGRAVRHDLHVLLSHGADTVFYLCSFAAFLARQYYVECAAARCRGPLLHARSARADSWGLSERRRRVSDYYYVKVIKVFV
jgi:hypothetical protein